MSKFIQKIKNFDVNGNSRILMLVPLVVILIMVICGTCYHLDNKSYDKFANIGVDFQGGTLLTVEFSKAGMNSGDAYDKNLGIIENVLENNGLKIAVPQASGDSTIIVRYLNTPVIDGVLRDYNGDEMVSEMNLVNDKVIDGLKSAVAEEYTDVTVKATATLIGNSASMRLLRTALISVAVALVLMLIYIVIRFDLYSALAAIVALLHDIIIMMAFTVIFYVEIGSSIVAAIITIVAYSINNTIIVFDKIRTLVKPYKKTGQKFDENVIINSAVRSTFTRTCFTTLTTLVVIALLAILGVASIRTFALPILFGLIGGFYSSVFLAGPLWGIFKDWGGKIKLAYKNRKFKRQRAKAAKTA